MKDISHNRSLTGRPGVGALPFKCTLGTVRTAPLGYCTSCLELGKTLCVRASVPEGRRIVAQGAAERRQPRSGTLGIQKNRPKPRRGGGKHAGSRNRGDLPSPFQGYPCLVVNPGFSAGPPSRATPWATIRRTPPGAKWSGWPCRVSRQNLARSSHQSLTHYL